MSRKKKRKWWGQPQGEFGFAGGKREDDKKDGNGKKIIHGNWEKEGHGPVTLYTPGGDPIEPGKEEGGVDQPGEWTTGDEPMQLIAEDCDFAKKLMPKLDIIIKFGPEVGKAIRYLIREVDIEWQLLLRGTAVQEGGSDTEIVYCNDYYIPKQEVGHAHVKNLDCIDKKLIQELGIIATMHSHSTMSAFFSPTDVRECNSSPIKYHVVINNRYEYQAVKQISLPCGMNRFGTAKIEFDDGLSRPRGFENIAQSNGYSGGATYRGPWSIEEFEKECKRRSTPGYHDS